MNLAALWQLPVIFFCENNLYGMGASVDQTLVFYKEIYKMANAYHMPSKRVDGMDVLAVREATKDVVERVRGGGGPFFIEAMTYRFRGHSMADPMEYRPRGEEEKWREKDPILALKNRVLAEGLVSDEELDAMYREVEREVEEAIAFADESPFPEPGVLHEDVYRG
jgi:pyruvate dehydrogenase E1 component alpha subunit